MINLINSDCLEYMKSIDDNSIDCIITDPPYELNKSGKNTPWGNLTSLQKFKKYSLLHKIVDGFNIDITLNECLRVLKKMNMFVFCSNKQISKLMTWGENKGFFTTLLVWHKHNSVPFANNTWRGDIEFIVHFREKGAIFQGNAELKQKVIKHPTNPSKYGHPTEKPLFIIERFIKIGSNENDIIFDPFMGSGSTGVACKNLNRKFIGCEIDKEYFDIANKRIFEQNLF